MSVRLPLRIQEGNVDSTHFREILYLGLLLPLADTLPFWLKWTERTSHDKFCNILPLLGLGPYS